MKCVYSDGYYSNHQTLQTIPELNHVKYNKYLQGIETNTHDAENVLIK